MTVRIRCGSPRLLLSLGVPALSVFLSVVVPESASAVAMWSRRYGVPCNYCHAYPSLQLTAEGADFFRRGHRIKNDSWDKNITHLLSAHGEWEWEVVQRESTAFQTPEFHVHAGGALTKAFSIYVDANINEDLENWLVPFLRWDDVTTKVEGETDRTEKGTIGCAIRLFQSEVTAGRIVLEGSRRKEGGIYTTAGLLNLLWIF